MKTLTFAETLHPESAQCHVGPRNGSTTAWGTVINQARDDLPVAVAVTETGQVLERPPGQVTAIPEAKDDKAEMPPGGGCFYLEGISGCCLAIAAVLAAYTVELVAAICYCLAAGIYYYFVKNKKMHIFIRAILILVVHALTFVDALLLAMGLILTETLGWVAGVVTSIFNLSRCCAAGHDWHIYVRKVCHLTRWAFRRFHDGWALPRMFPRLEFGDEALDCMQELPNPEQVVVAHQLETSPSHDSSNKV